MGGEQAGGFVAIIHTQALAGLVQVGVDGVLGDAELTADLLGAQMVVHQPQTFTLARRQELDGRTDRLLPGLAHSPELTI